MASIDIKLFQIRTKLRLLFFRALIFYLFLCVLSLSFVFAAESSSGHIPIPKGQNPKIFFGACIEILTAALSEQTTFLPRTKGISRYPEEFPKAGTIIRNFSDLSKLPDGIYVYLFSPIKLDKENETLIVAPRFQISEEDLARLKERTDILDLIDEMVSLKSRNFELEKEFEELGIKYLATHRSLYGKLIKEARRAGHGGRIPIIGAGEFLIRNAHLIEMSNEANTFRGQTSHLVWSAFRIFGLGLRPALDFYLLDTSRDEKMRVGPPHARQREEAFFQLKIRMSPELQKIHDDLSQLYNELAKSVPDPHVAGLMDYDTFMNFMKKDVEEDTDAIEISSRIELEKIDRNIEKLSEGLRDIQKQIESLKPEIKKNKETVESLIQKEKEIEEKLVALSYDKKRNEEERENDLIRLLNKIWYLTTFLDSLHREGPVVTTGLNSTPEKQERLKTLISIVREYIQKYQEHQQHQ